MIVLGNRYLFIFKIIFSYSPNGVQNIIKSKFGIIFFKSFVISHGNFNFLIFKIFDLDFS